MKEYFSTIIGINNLGKYNISLGRETLRERLMLLLYAVVLYTLPLQPSRSPIYCVHECLIDNLPLEMMSLISDNHTVVLYEPKYRPPKCDRFNISDKEAIEKKLKLANYICPLKEIERQGKFSLVCIFFLLVWGNIQGVWVFMSKENVLALKNIHKKLANRELCRNCPRKYLTCRVDDRICFSCYIREGDVHDFNLNRKEMKHWYFFVNFMSAVFGGLILCFLFMYGKEYQTWFECLVPDGHPMPIGNYFDASHGYWDPRDLKCFNPDSIVLQYSFYIAVALVSCLFVVFITNCFRSCKISYDLYLGVVEKPGTLSRHG